eukprot:scaffold56755_cov17-Tisochrysis_lutea.AAC.2
MQHVDVWTVAPTQDMRPGCWEFEKQGLGPLEAVHHNTPTIELDEVRCGQQGMCGGKEEGLKGRGCALQALPRMGAPTALSKWSTKLCRGPSSNNY